jgi:hypothetical protein
MECLSSPTVRASRPKRIATPFRACQAAPGSFITTSLGGRQSSEDVISESIVAELLRILVRELTDQGDPPEDPWETAQA